MNNQNLKSQDVEQAVDSAVKSTIQKLVAETYSEIVADTIQRITSDNRNINEIALESTEEHFAEVLINDLEDSDPEIQAQVQVQVQECDPKPAAKTVDARPSCAQSSVSTGSLVMALGGAVLIAVVMVFLVPLPIAGWNWISLLIGGAIGSAIYLVASSISRKRKVKV